MVRKLRILIAGAAAGLLATVLPSGAGQHFGVAGDLIAFPVTGSASAAGGLMAPTVEGFFAWGIVGSARDDGSAPSGTLDSFMGCVAITTDAGSDFGCVRDLRLPPSLSDPAMHEVTVQGAAPSERYPGAMIEFVLRFEATREPAPAADRDIETEPGTLRLALRAGVETTVLVTGMVRSVVGAANVEGQMGRYARGVIVDSCSYDGQPCPRPGS